MIESYKFLKIKQACLASEFAVWMQDLLQMIDFSMIMPYIQVIGSLPEIEAGLLMYLTYQEGHKVMKGSLILPMLGAYLARNLLSLYLALAYRTPNGQLSAAFGALGGRTET